MAAFAPPPLSSLKPEAFTPPPVSALRPEEDSAGVGTGLKKGSMAVRALTTNPTAPGGVLDTISDLSGYKELNASAEKAAAGDYAGAAKGFINALTPGYFARRLLGDQVEGSFSRLKQAQESYQKGDYFGALEHVGGAVPVLGPVIEGAVKVGTNLGKNAAAAERGEATDFSQAKEGAGMIAGAGIDAALFHAAGKAVPKVADGAARAAPAVKAGVKAAAPDVTAGAVKVASGAALDYVGLPYHAGTILGLHGGVPQIGRGVVAGVKAGRAAWKAGEAAPPVGTAAEYGTGPIANPNRGAGEAQLTLQPAPSVEPATAPAVAPVAAPAAAPPPLPEAPPVAAPVEAAARVETPVELPAAPEKAAAPSRYAKAGDDFKATYEKNAAAKDAAIADWLSHPDRAITAEQLKATTPQEFADLVKQVNPKYRTRITAPDFEARKQDVVDLLTSRASTSASTEAAAALDQGGVGFAQAKGMTAEQLGLPADAGPKAIADVMFQLKKLELAKRTGEPNAAPHPGETDATVDAGTTGARETLPEPVRPGAKTAGLQGNPTSIDVPGEARSYQGRYEVSELADLRPSHHGATFQPNPAYELRNDRNYDNAVNQAKVVDWSVEGPTGFKPANLINDIPDSSSGPPVTDSAGNVLGGNGRTMIMQRVASGNAKGAARYRQLLDQKAAQFGIDPASYAHMEQPILRRVIGDAEFTKAGSKQDAVTDFNKKGTAALTPAEQSIADSRRVTQNTLGEMSKRMDDLGTEATLAQVLEGKSGTEMLARLVDDGVISPQERAAFTTEEGLTKEGKARISGLMLGRFFENAAQMDTLPAALRNKVERIAAPLARLEGGEFSLSPQIKKALTLIEDAQTHGASSIDRHLEQSGLYAEEKYPPQTVALAKQLQSRDPVAITAAVQKYAEHAQYAADYQGPGLSGEFPDPVTPAAAFEEGFGAKALADEAAGKAAAKAAKAEAKKAAAEAEAKPGRAARVKEAALELARDKTGSFGPRKPKKTAAQLYDAAHQGGLFDEAPPPAASDNGTAAALKDALTKEIKFGRGQAGSIGGPLFDDQAGLFGDAPLATAEKYAALNRRKKRP